MLSLQIKNYDEFREIFGTRNSSHGRIINKILLAFWKHRFKVDGDARATQVKSLLDLYKLVMNSIVNPPIYEQEWLSVRQIKIGKLCYSFRSKCYAPVEYGVDFNNPKNIKYQDLKHQGKIYSMGAGKFLRKLFAELKVNLNEATITFCAEEFQRLWEGEMTKFTSGLTLHVNRKVADIYSQDKCEGNFGSCMVGRNRSSFYIDCVKASAAYLTNDKNKIVARCIIFHDVVDVDGNKHNYAERQYATDGNIILKTILINKLLEAGVIDIYKTVGMGCRDIQAISDSKGNKLKDPRLTINCRIPYGHTLSFMDTFIYYSPNAGIARNWHFSGAHDLGHTTVTFTGSSPNPSLPPIDFSNLPNI